MTERHDKIMLGVALYLFYMSAPSNNDEAERAQWDSFRELYGDEIADPADEIGNAVYFKGAGQ